MTRRALPLAALLLACGDLPDAYKRAPGSATAILGMQVVLVGSPVSVPPTVRVRDHLGVPLAGVPVHFSVTVGGGSIGTSDAVTDDEGLASAGSWIVGSSASNFVNATVEGISGGGVTFSARVVALKQITAGSAHTCAVGTTLGEAFCWGSNSVGQAGVQNQSGLVLNVGEQISPTNIAMVDAGFNHTCALTTNGITLCWGRNTFGQLGDGTTLQRTFPISISGTLVFTSLALGADHACGIVAAGNAYCWGLNASGQLGDGTTTNRFVPVAVSGALKFQSIAARGNHTCAVAITNVTYCWGENANGGLGDGTKVNRNAPTPISGGQVFQSLALGNLHSCGLSSGVAYCWGANTSGQLGDGTTTERLTPTPVTGGVTFGSLASNGAHTCGLDGGALAWCWGENANGQLGDGTKTSHPAPAPVLDGRRYSQMAAGGTHTCAVAPGGQAFCWGANSSGQLGDATFTERLAPVLIRLK